MKIKAITIRPDDNWLLAVMTLAPEGTLSVRVRRDCALWDNIWDLRKSKGEAQLGFVTKPGRIYRQFEIEGPLAQLLGSKELISINDKNYLEFDDGLVAYPTAILEPNDYLDNSFDVIRYDSDTEIRGLSHSV